MDKNFYSRFYTATENSPIHSLFCEFAYGIDLRQHGFADKEQLDLIIKTLPIKAFHSVLDVGCGGGMITEYLSDKSGASFTGIDNDTIAINQANYRTQSKRDKLTFIEGDMNDLCLSVAAFDIILLIDTIYFSQNYDLTISTLKAALLPQGHLLIFYSIGPALLGTREFPRYLLDPDKTPLAESLIKNDFLINHTDLTLQDYKLAKKRKEFLKNHKEEFEREGNIFIYENRMHDSEDFAQAIEEGIHRRYLYIATANA